MTIPLFDVQAGFGGANPGESQFVSAAEWLDTMAALSIDRALMRTEPDALDVDVAMSNDIIFAHCAGHAGLVPCPVVVPATGCDVPSEPEQVEALIRRGARAAAIRPSRDCWEIFPWTSDALFAAMRERHLPLYCLAKYVSFAQVADIAERFPELPILLAQVGYTSQRTLLPLLRTFRNVYLSLGNAFTVHRGIEQLVEVVGGEQLLFGTGFPAAEPMMAITQLMYAEISDEQKAHIGAHNLEHLLARVR